MRTPLHVHPGSEVRLLVLLGMSAAILCLVLEHGGSRPRSGGVERAGPSGSDGPRAVPLVAASAEWSERRPGHEPAAAVAAVPDVDPRARAALARVPRASLRGHLGRAGARLAFVAGPSKGRVVVAEPGGGAIEAEDLLPGLHLVQLSGVGFDGALRELALRPGPPTELVLDPGRRGRLEGVVVGAAGAALAGARVSLDGEATFSDGEGRFALGGILGGRARLVVEACGHAPWAENVALAEAPLERRVVLEPACRLELFLEGGAGLAGATEVQLVARTPPGGRGGARTHPWERLGDEGSTLRMVSGERRLLDGLAPGAWQIVAAHPLARSLPVEVRVRPDEPVQVVLTLRPLPLLALPGARTHEADTSWSVQACDPLGATRVAFGLEGRDFGRQPIDLAPGQRGTFASAPQGDGPLHLARASGRASEAVLAITDRSGRLLALRLLQEGLELGRDAREIP